MTTITDDNADSRAARVTSVLGKFPNPACGTHSTN